MSSIRDFTEEKLKGVFERDQRRRLIEREARQLQQENDLVLKDLDAVLQEKGYSSLMRGLYRAVYIEGRATVSWKDQFILHVGSGIAQQLIDEAVPSRRLTVVSDESPKEKK